MHFLEHKVKILIHLMISHYDWNQYKNVLPSVKEAKRKVQGALKPGGGGPNSTNIGKLNHCMKHSDVIRLRLKKLL